MIIICFFVAIGATILGSMAGLGGGVIIKPVLDFLGCYNLATVGMLSATTVFFMAIVSIGKQMRYKVKIEYKKTIFIGIGSIIGGVIGQDVIKYILTLVKSNVVTLIQSMILAILLILVLIYMNNKKSFKRYKVENILFCLLIGAALGGISSFLSIGGGPINLCILTLCFSMGAKEAAINSIIIIFFSQGAKIATITASAGLAIFHISVLPIMIIGGIAGGFIGSTLNKKVSDKEIMIIFNIVSVGLILLNVFNSVMAVIKL